MGDVKSCYSKEEIVRRGDAIYLKDILPKLIPKDRGKFLAVDVKAIEPLPKPVTLAQVKAEPRLKDMALVKYSRLSVQPVTQTEWKIVCQMAGKKA